jgi:hypothetical protein
MRTGKGDSCMAIVVGSSCFEDSLVRPCLTHVTVARERHGKGVASLLRRDAACICFYSTACSSSLQSGSRADLVYVIGAVKHLAHALWSSERALIEFDFAPMVCSLKHRAQRHTAVPRVMLRLSIVMNMTDPTLQRGFMVWA